MAKILNGMSDLYEDITSAIMDKAFESKHPVAYISLDGHSIVGEVVKRTFKEKIESTVWWYSADEFEEVDHDRRLNWFVGDDWVRCILNLSLLRLKRV